MSAENYAEAEAFQPKHIAEFFQSAVQSLLHENLELLHSSSLDYHRNVQALQLVDRMPQHRLPIDYHSVYESFDSIQQTSTYGVYIANPWRRSRRNPAHESRHYFSVGDRLIVREDRRNHMQEFEFLHGSVVSPAEAEDAEYAEVLAGLTADLQLVQTSRPLKPRQLLFNQFARPK